MEHVHQYGEIITEQVSCGNNQRLIRKCRICGAIEVIGVQSNVLNHHFADQKTLQHSTCMKSGRSECTCVRCGYTKQVTLPLSGHHYVKNNPFYQECRDCRKKALTPFAKRTLLISGTSALIGGGICFVLQHQLPSPADQELQKATASAITDLETGTVETTSVFKTELTAPDEIPAYETSSMETIDSETEFSKMESSGIEIIMTETNATESGSDETQLTQTAVSETQIPETAFHESQTSETISHKIQTSEITSCETQLTETASYETQTPETTAHEYEDFTPHASETERFTATVSETEVFTTSAVEITASETEPSTAAATKAEISESAAVETVTSTAPVTEKLQTTSADYTALTGEILNGSDLLNLIEEGAPLEIITSTGTRFCANVSISGAYPLADTELIPTSASYTVNVILSEQKQVIVCNQF
jgi:hypothetical protein